MKNTIRAVAACMVVGVCGCSGPAADEGPVTVLSDSGSLRVTLRMSPEPIQRGIDSAQLTLTDAADGGPVDDLTLAITPWMPAMDHGTSVTPTITPLGGGNYAVSNLVLYMAGHWEIRIAIGSDASDHATPAIDVP